MGEIFVSFNLDFLVSALLLFFLLFAFGYCLTLIGISEMAKSKSGYWYIPQVVEFVCRGVANLDTGGVVRRLERIAVHPYVLKPAELWALFMKVRGL